jgi:hypothetical protein
MLAELADSERAMLSAAKEAASYVTLENCLMSNGDLIFIPSV